MKKNVKSFLERTKLIAETITAIIPLAKLTLVATGVLALVMYVKYNNKQDEMDLYISSYNIYKTKAEETTKLADSLKNEVIIQENKTQQALTLASNAGKQVDKYKQQTTVLLTQVDAVRETITDSIELARVVIPIQDSIIINQKITISEQDVQIKELYNAIDSKDISLKLSLQRGDSLQVLLDSLPPAPTNPNRIFGIKLPSRKTTLLVGIGIGIGASFMVKK